MKNIFKGVVQRLFQHLSKLQKSPYAIAAGFACGAAISMTPLVGFHMILGVCSSFLIRASTTASLIGTIVGNPWTFAVIWPLSFETGRKILGIEETKSIDFAVFFENFKVAILNLNFNLLKNDLSPILKPMLVGCIPYYIIVWIGSYCFIRYLIKK